MQAIHIPPDICGEWRLAVLFSKDSFDCAVLVATILARDSQVVCGY
jgi:hypothetical protein